MTEQTNSNYPTDKTIPTTTIPTIPFQVNVSSGHTVYCVNTRIYFFIYRMPNNHHPISNININIDSNGNGNGNNNDAMIKGKKKKPKRDASEWKEQGSKLYSAGMYKAAHIAYKSGVEVAVAALERLSDEEQERDECCDAKEDAAAVLQALYSNLSLCLQKLELYDQAIHYASEALNMKRYFNYNPDKKGKDMTFLETKLLYRRAICIERHVLVCTSTEVPSEKLKAMMEAQCDLERCTKLLRESIRRHDGPKLEQEQDLKRKHKKKQSSIAQKQVAPAEAALARVTARVEGMSCHATSTESPSIDIEIQRNTILRLLDASSKVSEGQVYFIVPYRWWKCWCEFVKFENFELLPEGGTRISQCMYKALRNGDASDDSDSSDKDEVECIKNRVVHPGPLNGMELLVAEKGKDNVYDIVKDDSFNVHFRLRDNLVRGYHYEVLPREAYHAFKEWYGEDPKGRRILRRVCRIDNHMSQYPFKIQLYQQESAHVSEKKIEYDKLENVRRCSACRNVAVRRCGNCERVYYCSKSCQAAHWSYHKSKCGKSKFPMDADQLELGFWGCRGLGNLGNTCFMNCSIQCLSHAYPLTQYFLSNRFEFDINRENPLGTKGNLARAYETTLKELYWSDKSYINPTQLKRSIARFQPRFAGYSQEDAPEFLAYILDG